MIKPNQPSRSHEGAQAHTGLGDTGSDVETSMETPLYTHESDSNIQTAKRTDTHAGTDTHGDAFTDANADTETQTGTHTHRGIHTHSTNARLHPRASYWAPVPGETMPLYFFTYSSGHVLICLVQFSGTHTAKQQPDTPLTQATASLSTLGQSLLSHSILSQGGVGQSIWGQLPLGQTASGLSAFSQSNLAQRFRAHTADSSTITPVTATAVIECGKCRTSMIVPPLLRSARFQVFSVCMQGCGTPQVCMSHTVTQTHPPAHAKTATHVPTVTQSDPVTNTDLVTQAYSVTKNQNAGNETRFTRERSGPTRVLITNGMSGRGSSSIFVLNMRSAMATLKMTKVHWGPHLGLKPSVAIIDECRCGSLFDLSQKVTHACLHEPTDNSFRVRDHTHVLM